ncbi:MAG: metallophosphatase [Nitrosospira sp.]|nr:metallophosphatase [Nitrosospira sp.]
MRTKTLSSAVPNLLDGTFNILLASCFYHAEDKAGQAGRLMEQLAAASRPDLTLLLGDQVYLDLPTLMNFPPGDTALARRFEGDYRANWQGEAGYSQLLRLAPTISVPDDHEYWNNFPHPSPFIQNSWTQTGRDSWTVAATALYQAFQFTYEPDTYLHGGPAELGDASVINVEPLSLFLADGRSKRDPDRASVFTPRARAQLTHWVSETITSRRIGLFVTGQSLLDSPAREWKGKIADYLMPNYGDFQHITSELGRLVEAGLPIILITGDVHWGRVAAIRDTRTERESIFEIISSPTSLVSSVGKDQLSVLKGAIKNGTNIWPRHSQPAPVPEFLWFSAFGARFNCSQAHKQTGNHVAVLSFTRTGPGVRLRITYYPLHEDLIQRRAEPVRDLSLMPA